jgi:membrane-associated protease RseP (regulator of RpoE activity)
MRSRFTHHDDPVRPELASSGGRGGSPGMERNRYLDLLRVAAIGGVVYGHWLLISVTCRNGQLSGADALDYVAWGRWVTWVFQVMPIFFLVGGYVDAQSWAGHHAEGQSWTVWVRDRAMRLWWPTAVFVVAGILAVVVARAAGVGAAQLAQAGWLAAQQEQQQEQNGGFGSGRACYTSNADVTVPSAIAPASSGTLILGTICGSPAVQAGMTGGAVIPAVNGQAVGSPDDLGSILARLHPGEVISVTWVSPSGQRTTSSVHLAAGPPQ